MTFRRQLYYTLPTVFLLVLFCEADLATVVGDNSISNLYENLLQREYPGPVVFPNHQVERKAQRSPSLRLRFGRRSDPDLMLSAEKRWFGDVRQKPIRSPSLRLRFGRRSDPTMPLHSSFDVLMNNLAAGGGGVSDGGGIDENALEQDYDGGALSDGVAAYDAAASAGNGFERAVRKPQRLRWGRSVPVEWTRNTKELEAEEQQQQQFQRTDDILNALMNSEKFQNLIMNLRRYNDIDGPFDSFASDEFAREARKPGPLRLRWGRSTGGAASSAAHSINAETVAQEKKSTENFNVASEKSSTQQNNETKK